MKLILIIISSLFISSVSFAQRLQNGLIYPKNFSEEICCIYSPKNGFNIYSEPGGEKIGKLSRNIESNTGSQAPYKIFFVKSNNQSIWKINIGNFAEVGYEIWSIVYFERRDGFVRVVDKSVNFWIKEKDIDDAEFEVLEWPDFIIGNPNNGYFPNEPGLNLRKQATTDSPVIKTMKGDLYSITPTKERKGLWVKVKVKKYKEHPCGTSIPTGDLTEFELEGWLKMVDDDGTPNMWFYTRGC